MDEFDNWANRFRTKALRQGISHFTFDSSFSEVRFDKNVIALDRNQPETGRTIWAYLDAAVSDSRIQIGREKLSENRVRWKNLEKKFGVERDIIAAIWGLESAYGKVRGEFPVIEALATLAFDGRRKELFEGQLIAALQVIQSGEIPPTEMRGSWAGAMGHTQFMPVSYMKHAFDFDCDGKCNIWGDDPWDALASTAVYLASLGWQWGRVWGVEVSLNKDGGLDYGLFGLGTRKEPNEWTKLGVMPVISGEMTELGPASILLPAGANGPAFMVSENFRCLLQYNGAIPYGLAVGYLAVRIAGGPAFTKAWPRNEKQLSGEERKELQERLSLAGFDTKGADGIVGPNTFAALRKWQKTVGVVADGYPTVEILKQLRG